MTDKTCTRFRPDRQPGGDRCPASIGRPARYAGAVRTLGVVSATVTEAINATTRFTEIKRQLSGLDTGIERIKELVDEVRTDIRGALTALQDEVDRQISGGERAA